MCGRWVADARLAQRRRKVAAGSTTSPPPDHSGVYPPVGHPQFPLTLSQGQFPDSRRGHPCSRQCLLKGCERWFLPHHFQARYCSPACRMAARRWRRWYACQRYRATDHGKQRRRATGPTPPGPPTAAVDSAPTAPTNAPKRARSTTGGRRCPAPDRSAQPPSTPSAWASAQPKFRKILWSGPATGQAATSFSPDAAFPPAAILFLLLPPGVTTRPAAGSPTPQAATPRRSDRDAARHLRRHPEQARYVVMY